MDKKQLGKMVNIAIPVLAVLLIAESIYAVLSLTKKEVEWEGTTEEITSVPETVAMKMSTEPDELMVGEEFVLWVKADLLADYELSGSDVFVTFDPAGFEVVEETASAGAVLEKEVSFSKVLRNVVDEEKGQVIVSVVEDDGLSLKSGTTVDIVGIRFRAVESGDYEFLLTKKGEESKAGSTFVEKSEEAREIEFTVEPLSVTVM